MMIQAVKRVVCGLCVMLAFASVAAERDGAFLDSPPSLIEQALRSQHGEGVKRDPLRAAELYCAAVRKDSAEVAYHLGWMYANGRGFERDDGYAVALFRRAADQGHEYAQRILRLIHSNEARLPDCAIAPISSLLAKIELAKKDQLELADLAKAQSAIAELAKAEQLAKTELRKAELARDDLEKAKQFAKTKRTNKEELWAPGDTQSARQAVLEPVVRIQPPAGRDESSNAVSQRNEIASAIFGWAAAWSKKDVNAYLAAYSEDFIPPGGQRNHGWAQQRRMRILNKGWIDVEIRELEISVQVRNAQARFVQDYRSDRLTESSRKVLTLVNRDRAWLIRKRPVKALLLA